MHQSRAVIRTKGTKFRRDREERGVNIKHTYEDNEDIDLSAIRCAGDALTDEDDFQEDDFHDYF